MISVIYENNTTVAKVGNAISCWFRIESGISKGCVLSPFIWIILIYLRSTGKAMWERGIKWRRITFFYLDCTDNLIILDESVSKMNELLEVLRVQADRIGCENKCYEA